ncbi:MAG TPA: heparinase II/III family protein, partial [Candidatus Hydrogenedentes bacterium]|nr:heparinase II/III family protein [Candidatus Hydrogenedentota bacterium]
DVAEMTAALAIGYDWLFNSLAADARNTIRDAIVDKGLETSMKGGGWVMTTNNWNQVCHGGLTLGALALFEDEPELSKRVIARAIKYVPRAMDEYEPDGVYPEGPSYWLYGTTYNVLMIAALESVLGSDFGLASAEGFLKTPEFYLHATGPTGLFFNFADCGFRSGPAPAMHWFAQRRNDPTLLWREKATLEQLAVETPSATDGGDRMLPLLLAWGQPVREATAPRTLHWKGDGPVPVAMLRSAWQDDATYMGVKGGSPSANHGHMDIGSFVLDMKGVRWAVDLGMEAYHALEARGLDLWNRRQESERWTVFRLNNHSHNTLVIDGQLQRVEGNARITRFSDDPGRPFAVVDMTSAYEGQVDRARRGVRLMGDAVLIQDEVAAPNRAVSIRWAMATRAEVTIAEDGGAVLRQDGQTVSLRVLAPANARLTVRDIENPPREFDSKNPNTRMVGFEALIPAATTETWGVLLEPDAPSDTPPTLDALDAW